jgi:hypothetical protein
MIQLTVHMISLGFATRHKKMIFLKAQHDIKDVALSRDGLSEGARIVA